MWGGGGAGGEGRGRKQGGKKTKTKPKRKKDTGTWRKAALSWFTEKASKQRRTELTQIPCVCDSYYYYFIIAVARKVKKIRIVTVKVRSPTTSNHPN